jgi:hypothetical protein
MTDKAMLNQRSAADFVDIQTDWPTGLDVSSHPDDLASVATVSNTIVGGGNMSFICHDGEVTADLVTLMLEAVSGELRSLLSDMLPTMLFPEAVRVPHFHSAAVPLPTTVEALSVALIAPPPTSKYLRGAPTTFERGESAVTVSGLNGTRTREFGSVLLRFLKNLLSSVLTAKPAKGGNHTMMMPSPWSARPMAFARYAHPHAQGVNGVSNEMEKRHHFPVTEAAHKR